MAAARKKEATPSFFESLYVTLTADANEVVDGLYLGAAAAGEDGKAMLKKRISHVLLCHPTLKERHPQHFKYGRAPLADEPHQNLLEHLPDAIEFIGKARKTGGRVFVCCMKGISRSSSVVISYLMLDRLISFDEAFKVCEQKRPVVYPNVGFQQQLRFLERTLSVLTPGTPWEQRVQHVRFRVPSGALDSPSAPLRIHDSIGQSMVAELDEAEGLVERVFAQPQLLQQRELWKRHGLFFENFHKYKALPSDPALLDRAKAVRERLRALPKIYSESLKGVKLALAVASEIESWAKFAEPALASAPSRSSVSASDSKPEPQNQREAGCGDSSTASDAESSASDIKKDAKKDKKGKAGKKKSKKDIKREKKQKKIDKKAEKVAKKANKAIAKIERAALQAETSAEKSLKEAELASQRATAAEKELADMEAAEVAKVSLENARKLAKRAASRSSSRSPARRRKNSPERRLAAEAYEDLL